MIQQTPKVSLAREQRHELRRLRRFARLMDTAIRIPGTKIRIGLDSIAGLVPLVGDGLTAIASAYIIHRAAKLGARKRTLAKMYRNVAVDMFIGCVPLVGDLFDVSFKSNTRNLGLLEDDIRDESSLRLGVKRGISRPGVFNRTR